MQHTKHILAAAALLTLAGAASAQSTEFNWYGRIDLGLESTNDGDVSRVMASNFASRLGIRGEHKLNANLSAVFQVETGVAPDDTANSKAFANRNSFVGLKTATAGTVLVGTYDMPFKALEGTAGGLWGQGDLLEILVNGKGSRVAIGNANFQNLHTRKTNVLHYASPKFANAIVAKLAYSPDEAKTTTQNKTVFGASVEYNDGMFNGGVAIENQKDANGVGFAMKGTKFTLGTNLGAFSAGVAVSKLDNSKGNETSNVVLTGAYALDSALTLKASLGKSGESKTGLNDGIKGMAFEANYAIDKQVTTYAYFTKLTNDSGAKGTLVASDNFPAATANGKDPRALGLGVRYTF
ncbi:porin [Leptothrix discophora]|uniref:Porin n=1 Tax=Leptothrix discophora TaxID=89 RepID=A0ABT9G942_LEPDI|nr:porin [Leptothrix discophora]MDP4302966.1 porin [Leptothrix discophora]